MKIKKETKTMDKSYAVKQIPFYELLTDEQKKEAFNHSKIKEYGQGDIISGFLNPCMDRF